MDILYAIRSLVTVIVLTSVLSILWIEIGPRRLDGKVKYGPIVPAFLAVALQQVIEALMNGDSVIAALSTMLWTFGVFISLWGIAVVIEAVRMDAIRWKTYTHHCVLMHAKGTIGFSRGFPFMYQSEFMDETYLGRVGLIINPLAWYEYLLDKLLSPPLPELEQVIVENELGWGTVTATVLNARDYPSTRYGEVIRRFEQGDMIHVAETNVPGWYWIYPSNGIDLYVSADYIRLS